MTLAMWPDTNAIAKAGLLPLGWEKSLPNDSLPYTSTIVFVVRKGNPKGIKDWPDIIKPGVEIVTPNPKTSGNGKLVVPGGLGLGHRSAGGSDAEALAFVKKMYEQTPVLDLGARAATTTFVQKNIGDVHLAWENEAQLEVQEAEGRGRDRLPADQLPRRAARRGGDEERRAQGHGRRGEGVPRVPLHARGPGDHREELLPPDRTRRCSRSTAAPSPTCKLFKIDAVAKSWDDA